MAAGVTYKGNARVRDQEREHHEARVWSVISILCLLAAPLPFIIPALPVGTDLYKHVMVARVLADFQSTFFGYSKYFSIQWWPHPSMLGDLTLAALLKVLGPIDATKAYFAVFAATLWLAGRRYLRVLEQPSFAVILLIPFVQSFYAFSAFLPFLGAIALYPVLLATLLSNESRPRKCFWTALILILLYGFHPVGAVIGGFTVGIFAIDLARRRLDWALLSSLLPVTILTGAWLWRWRRGGGPSQFFGPLGQIKAYIGYNVWSLSGVAAWLFLALIAIVAVVAAWHAWAKRIADGRLLFVSITMVLIGLFMPYRMGAEFVVGSRTFPFAFIAGLGSLRWDRRLLQVCVMLACALIGVSTVLNTAKVLAVQPSYKEFLSGIPFVKPGSKVLPIIGDLAYGGNKYIQPFNSVEDLYNIYRGGANPYVFAEPFVRTGGNLLKAKFASGPVGKFGPLNPRDYHDAARDYEYVVCWGVLHGIKPLIAKEDRLVFSNGPLAVYARP